MSWSYLNLSMSGLNIVIIASAVQSCPSRRSWSIAINAASTSPVAAFADGLTLPSVFNYSLLFCPDTGVWFNHSPAPRSSLLCLCRHRSLDFVGRRETPYMAATSGCLRIPVDHTFHPPRLKIASPARKPGSKTSGKRCWSRWLLADSQ